MSTQKKSPVLTFPGEENLIVPKQNLGKPGRARYAMVTGSRVAPPPITMPVPPTNPETPLPPLAPGTTTPVPTTSIPIVPYEDPGSGPLPPTGGGSNTPAPTPAPPTTGGTTTQEPASDYNLFTCNQIAAEIDRINALLLTGKFPIDVRTSYENSLNQLKGLQSTKCAKSDAPILVVPTTSTPSPVGGGGGFGGGGGAGMPDESGGAIAENPNASRNRSLALIAILLIAGYLLTRKKNKS